MKLYFTKGACALGPNIALCEAGIPFDLEPVNLATKKTRGGGDFTQINPKGQVPTLVLNDGKVLTEAAVIMQFIADQKPEANLLPKLGTFERYRCQEWLNFIATELHKGFSPLWSDKTPAEMRETVKGNLAKRFDVLSAQLKAGPFLMGKQFTVADGYLFNILSWSPHVGVELAKWPVLMGFMETMRARPAVIAALKGEGFS